MGEACHRAGVVASAHLCGTRTGIAAPLDGSPASRSLAPRVSLGRWRSSSDFGPTMHQRS